jgi:hypothetical protein
MNNDELKMLKNGRRFLFVGGALDGKCAFVDKNESDVYPRGISKNRGCSVS